MSQKSRHIPIRTEWLSLRHEDPIDPDLLIVDAHHHLWNKPESRYFASDMLEDIEAGHNVIATVAVEAKAWYDETLGNDLASLGETRRLTEMAKACDPLRAIGRGIVGHVNLTLGQKAGEVLDRHIEAAEGRFVGVRNTSAYHPDPEARGSILLPPEGLFYQDAFRLGLAELSQRGLVFDGWMYHTQLDELADLAKAFPDLRIVVDHQGGPIGIGPYAGKRAEVFADWKQKMARLAELPSISVKLGGFGMLMSGFDFHECEAPASSDDLAAGWGPYIRTCVELFGASRCMFESNFPVDKGTTSYNILWNAYKKVVADLSADERRDLFMGTANRIYRLNLTQAG